MPEPLQDSIFPFMCEELHLTGYRLPVEPIKVKNVYSFIKFNKYE